MTSSLKGKGKEFSSCTAEMDSSTAHADSSGGFDQPDSASLASKLAASASGLTRGLLGIDVIPESAASALNSSGIQGKPQTPPLGDTSAPSAWAEGLGSFHAEIGGRSRYRPSFRTETRREQEPELEFASFLERQPAQTFESSSITTESYQPIGIGETPTYGQQSAPEPAQRARDILVANGVNPNHLTASQFQSFQQQDAGEQQQSIRSYVLSGNATWDPESANGSNTEIGCYQRNLQATSEENNQHSESEQAKRARNILIINDINPDFLTASQFLSFQQEDLSNQKHLIRTYFEDLNCEIRGNGWARQAVNETRPIHFRKEQLDDPQEQNPRFYESCLQLYNRQDSPVTQQHRVRVDTNELKAPSEDPVLKRNLVVGQMNPPEQNTSRARRAIELLVGNGINPEQLTTSQFNSFQQQNLNVQRKSVEVYLQNLAQHERSMRQQEEDGAAVVALLSQPNFLDLIDTSQDDDGLPPIWSLDLTPSQLDTIERLKSLLPTPPTSHPPSPTHALNLLPTSALTIPSPWDPGYANMSYTYFAEQADRRQQWLRDWDGVLRRYADEVWGDLLPLVEEAREEIEEAKENDEGLLGEGRAMRRLAMILGHLRDDKTA